MPFSLFSVPLSPMPADFLLSKRLAINGDNAAKHVMQACYPFSKAPLKCFDVQTRKQDAQLIMARCPVLEGKKPTQQIELLFAVKRDRCPTVWARNYGSVAKLECIFAFGQFCAILFSKESKAGAIHDD